MLIPVVFTILPLSDGLIYTWIFYKGVDFAKRYGWPVFAQSQYFHERDKQKNLGLISSAVEFVNDFDEVSDEDLRSIMQEEFPQEMIDAFIARFPSQTDAFIASMKDPWQEMTAFMVERIRECEQEKNERTEALICLGAPRFVEDAAKELGVPVIHYEWGPFRLPVYRRTAYFDLKGTVCNGEMLERYEAFQKVRDELPIFKKKEILAFFLTDLTKLSEPEVVPEYKIGLALGYNSPTIYTAYSQMTMTEALNEAHRFFSDRQIAVRYHPHDPVHGRMTGPQNIEADVSLIDFIKNCERIVCISSNIAYEAMLWNRPAYDLGSTMYGVVGNHALTGLPDKIAPDDFLSFIAFSYLIPFELLKNVEYIRWRLTRPTEKEIYLYHLKYYMDCLGLSQRILEVPEEERLNCIVRERGMEITLKDADEDTGDDLIRAYAKNERLKGALQKQQEKSQQLQEQLNQAQNEIQRLQEQLNQAQGDSQYLQGQLGQTQSEIQRLQEQLGQTQSEIQRLQEQLNQTQNEKQLLQERLNCTQNEKLLLQEQQNQRQNDNQFLQGQLNLVQSENQFLQGQLSRTQDENRFLQGQLSQTQGENQRLQEQVAQMQGENQRLQEQVSQTQGENQRLQEQVSQTQSENQRLQEQVAQTQGENQRLREQVSQTQSENQRLQEQVSQMQGENQSLQEQVSQIQSENQSLQEQVSQTQSENQSLQEQVIQMQNEKQLLDSQYQELQEQNRVHLEELEEQRRENEALRQTLSWRITKPLRALKRFFRQE